MRCNSYAKTEASTSVSTRDAFHFWSVLERYNFVCLGAARARVLVAAGMFARSGSQCYDTI